MCITKAELNQRIEKIREYKALKEEVDEIIKSLETEVISYMNENGITEELTDNAKISYKETTRVTLDKNKLTEILGEDLKPYEKVTVYKSLRIK